MSNRTARPALAPTLILAAAAIMAPLTAVADFGFANSHCSRWLDPELADEEMARRQWVLGYLTAFNRYGGREITNTDPNALLEKLREHCAAHPKDSLEAATEALLSGIE